MKKKTALRLTTNLNFLESFCLNLIPMKFDKSNQEANKTKSDDPQVIFQ